MLNPTNKYTLADLQMAMNTFSDFEETLLLVLLFFKSPTEMVFSLNNHQHLNNFFSYLLNPHTLQLEEILTDYFSFETTKFSYKN